MSVIITNGMPSSGRGTLKVTRGTSMYETYPDFDAIKAIGICESY